MTLTGKREGDTLRIEGTPEAIGAHFQRAARLLKTGGRMATQTTMPGIPEPYSEEAALARQLRDMANTCLDLARENGDSPSSVVRQVAAFAADAAGKLIKAANNIDKVLTRAKA